MAITCRCGDDTQQIDSHLSKTQWKVTPCCRRQEGLNKCMKPSGFFLFVIPFLFLIWAAAARLKDHVSAAHCGRAGLQPLVPMAWGEGLPTSTLLSASPCERLAVSMPHNTWSSSGPRVNPVPQILCCVFSCVRRAWDRGRSLLQSPAVLGL